MVDNVHFLAAIHSIQVASQKVVKTLESVISSTVSHGDKDIIVPIPAAESIVFVIKTQSTVLIKLLEENEIIMEELDRLTKQNRRKK